MTDSRESSDMPPSPGQIPERTETRYSRSVTEAWIAESMMSIQHNVGGIKADITALKSDAATQRQDTKTDLNFHLRILGGAFILLAGMIISAYLLHQNKMEQMSLAQQRIDTKLEDLLARLPATVTPPRGTK